MANDRSRPTVNPVFRQFTLRQSLLILTIVAVLAGILRHLRLDSIQLYGFLLAPALVYGLVKLLGIAIVPAKWISRRLVVIACGLLLLTVAVVGSIQHLALVLFLPLASIWICLLYTSPSPRDLSTSRMPSSA